jgi:hypothetical protein
MKVTVGSYNSLLQTFNNKFKHTKVNHLANCIISLDLAQTSKCTMHSHRITTAKCEINTDIVQGMKNVPYIEHPYISTREYLYTNS